MSLFDAMRDALTLRPIRPRAAPLAIFFAAFLSTTPARAQTTYTWNDSTTSWTTATAWNPNGPADWTDGQRLVDTLASFGSTATIANVPSINSTVLVAGISIDNTQADWDILGSASLNIGGNGLTVTGAGNKSTTLAASTFLSLPQTWTVGQGMSLSATNTVSGSSNLTKAGPGELLLSNNANSLSGAITIAGGTLIVSSIGNGGANSALGASTAAAGNLKFAGAGATLKYTGAGNSTDRQFTVSESGATINASGIGALNFTSTAALTYTGSAARTLTFDGTNTDPNTLAAAIADGPGGPTSVVKTGPGTWVLSGAATYTGATTATGGYLVLKGDRSTATGTVTASNASVRLADGTVLGGNLRLDRGFQASQSGTDAAMTNSPNLFGDSPGHVTILGSMTMDNECIVEFELEGHDPGTQYDRVDVGQNLFIGNATLDLVVRNFAPSIGDSFFILNVAGSSPISGQFANAPQGSIISADGYSFEITYFADADTQSFAGGNDIALMSVAAPVPEPASMCLALSAAALLAARTARRKSRR